MLITSFSGGRTSAYMAYKILHSEQYRDEEKVFVFANTGKERPETLDFVHECDRRWNLDMVWLEAVINPQKGIGPGFKIVDYATASRKGEPFNAMIEKFGIPNNDYPHCTRELKQEPIRKFAKSLEKDYQMAIGMRLDEPSRINRLKAERERWIYPLVDTWPTFELQVRNFWACMDFDLQLKDYEGNCDLCWKKSRRKRMTIIAEHPGIEKPWQEWERQDEYVFDRDGYSIAQLVEMSQKPFSRVRDRHEVRAYTPDLFGMDVDGKCMCFA